MGDLEENEFFKEGDIKYQLKMTATGMPPDHDSGMSLNMHSLWIRIEDDDHWYRCGRDQKKAVKNRIRKMGSPLAYILSLGYNELYHYLMRKIETLDGDKDSQEKLKIEKLIEQIEDLHGTCSNVES